LTLPKIEPLRPARSTSVPVGRDWIYELKLDGFRGMLQIANGTARFTSKNSNWMRRFDALAAGLARALGVRNAILDGEILVMGKEGPDFRALFFNRREPSYAAFDLLWLNNRDLRALPLWRRKNALRKLVASTPIGFVDHVTDPSLYSVVAQRDLEGIVAKRRTDPYRVGTPWVKVKCRSYSQMEGRWELFDNKRR
jgi:bifunctional non-homologous end joining protein LigD